MNQRKIILKNNKKILKELEENKKKLLEEIKDS